MKRIGRVLAAVLVFLGAAILFSSSVLAWGYICTEFSGTPGPFKIHTFPNQVVKVTNVGNVVVKGAGIRFTPPLSDGLKVHSYAVVKNGKVICKSFSCSAGDLNPGESIVATVVFRAQRIGKYEDLWVIVHDGIQTYVGGLYEVVGEKKQK